MNKDFPISVSSALEYRMKQVVPGFLLLLPILHHHQNYLQNNNNWPTLIFVLLCIFLASFITETIGEIIEHKCHWRYWKKHTTQLGKQHITEQVSLYKKINDDLKEILNSITCYVMGRIFIETHTESKINISSEWFEYLKRNTNEVLIADKYIHSLVDRMKLRCALVLPFILNAIYAIYKDYPTWTGLMISITFLILALCMFRSSRSDEKELINIRKSLIKQNNYIRKLNTHYY